MNCDYCGEQIDNANIYTYTTCVAMKFHKNCYEKWKKLQKPIV